MNNETNADVLATLNSEVFGYEPMTVKRINNNEPSINKYNLTAPLYTSPLANQGTFTDVTIIDSCLIHKRR
jgi:hypothetical protein